MRVFALLFVFVAGFAGACRGDTSTFVYRPERDTILDARFVNSADTLFVYEVDSNFVGTYRLISLEGETLSNIETAGYRQPPGNGLLLADARHLLLRKIGEGAPDFAIAPADEAETGTAREVLNWIERAGGLLDDREGFSASTNAYADISCAVAANKTISVWGLDAGLTTSPEIEWLTRDAVRWGVHCLRADGRTFVALVGFDRSRPAGERNIVRILEAGTTTLSAELTLSFRGRPVSMGVANVAAADTLVGARSESDFSILPQMRSVIATRIRRNSMRWEVEFAEVPASPSDLRWVRVRRADIVLGLSGYPNDVFISRWPEEGGIEAIDRRFRVPSDDFYRSAIMRWPPQVSPSGRAILWRADSEELRVERSVSGLGESQ